MEFFNVRIDGEHHKMLKEIHEKTKVPMIHIIQDLIKEHSEWIDNPHKKAMKENGKKVK